MIPPPLRFLLLVLGSWTVGRAIVLSLPAEVTAPVRRLVANMQPVAQAAEDAFVVQAPSAAPHPRLQSDAPARKPGRAADGIDIILPRPTYSLHRQWAAPQPMFDAVPGLVAAPALPSPQSRDGRWAGSAWLFLRGKAGASLAPGGTLGGSQAGGRVTYALGSGAALSARAYLPIEEPEAAEVALGIDLKPIRSVPLHILIERREAAGARGRSAFATTVYGGVADLRVSGPVLLDVYAQAGVVGLRSHDLFADGSARLHVRTGGANVGAGIWGAVQPGAERLDIGPTLSLPLPVGTVQADWRVRIAGDARPGSGIAVTLAADF